MKVHEDSKKFKFLSLWILLAMCFCASNAIAEKVGRAEAVAVADFWYAAEINADHTKLDAEEKAERLANLRQRKLLYYDSENELSGTRPEKGKKEIFAYIVKYEPSGYVVVSAEDRIRPVLVFDVKSPFRFDQPSRNFMPFYLETTLQGQWKALREQIDKGNNPPVHQSWTKLRSMVARCRDVENAIYGEGRSGSRAYYVLWDTALWGQSDPYNDTAKINNGFNDVPTGCVATAMAIKMRYHEWPNTGVGSHSYNDEEGSIRYTHSVNFGAQTYDWSAMPTESLDPFHSYPDVADLMYHCGVSVEMDYELGGSSAATSDTPLAMINHFNYRGFIWNTSSHETDLINSMLGGIPSLMRWPGHAMVADGYRDTGGPFFHVNLGWNGGSNGWYNLDDVLGHEIAGTGPYGQPMNWIYVSVHHTGTETGLLRLPFNTIGEGYTYTPVGGKLWIRGGTYTGPGNEPITLTKAMEIKAYNGTVVIE